MHWHLMAVSRLCTRDSTATFSIHSCMHYPCYSYHFKKYLQTYPNFIYDSHRFSRYTILYDMYVAALQLNAAPLLAECETPKRCSSYRQRGYIYILCMYIYMCVVHFHMFPIHYLSDMLTQTCFFFFESQGVNWTQCWSIWMLSWANLRTRTANVLRCIVKRLGKHRLNVSTVADLHLI